MANFTLQDEAHFQACCFDLERFMVHVSVDENSIEDNPIFKKCSKCNRPTIDHKKPVHSKCTQEVINDVDDIFDIEDMLTERQEFKEAFGKLMEKYLKSIEETESDENLQLKSTSGSDKDLEQEINLHKELNLHALDKIEKLEQENLKIKAKNAELLEENLSLKTNLNMKNGKINILIDNMQMILTEFSKEEFEEINVKSKKETAKYIVKEAAHEVSFKDQLTTLAEPIFSESENFASSGTKRKIYSCTKCTKTFILKNDLLKHSKDHTIEDFGQLCNQCDYKSSDMDDLKQHTATVHEVNFYECDKCDKKLNNTNAIETHIKNDHKPTIFKCEDCDAKFTCNNNFTKHKRAHEKNSFCHTFNNFPRCQYGNSCLFLHIKAPFCNFDGRCSRPSCQYRHRFGCVEKNRFDSFNFMKRRLKDAKDNEKGDAKNGMNSNHNDLNTQNKNLSGGI